jgi:hypothetical protein
MFENAIEKANGFTRPLLSISRNYGSERVLPGAATLFFINNEGWAFTCRHVAEQLLLAVKINEQYDAFKGELNNRPAKIPPKQWKHDLEKKYKYTDEITVELKNRFINCVDNIDIKPIMHPDYDIALLKFNNFNKIVVTGYPKFPKDTSLIKQGRLLCKLGFPFPEFNNFQYDKLTNSISWTTTGNPNTPVFPMDGMVTRFLNGKTGEIMGFEMNTPGLCGQSGGPIFDENGSIWGMQFATGHLDLNFDIDQKVIRNGKDKKVSDHAFLNTGLGIHINVMKDFMKKNNVTFIED